MATPPPPVHRKPSFDPIDAARRLTWTVGAGLGALLIAPLAAAQPATPPAQDGGTGPAADDGVTTLDPITVTGRSPAMPTHEGGQVGKRGRVGFLGDRHVMETPFSTTTYTSRFIENQQADDIQEVISKTDPTVFLSGVPGESQESYSIRGLPANVGDVTVDGLAGIGAYYRGVPEMYERIEVQRGPSALLGGMPPKGSAGGTVNLVPKRAADEPLTRVTTSYMSRSHFGGHVDAGRRFGTDGQFGIRINGVYRDGETAVRTQDKNLTGASVGLDWRGARATASLDLYQSREHMSGLTRGLTLAPGLAVPAVPDPKYSWNPPWAYYDTRDRGAIVRGEYRLSDGFTAYAAAGVARNALETNMALPQVIDAAGNFNANFSGVSERVNRRSAEVGLRGQARTGAIGHRFAVNATYYDEEIALGGFRNLLAQPWRSNIYAPAWGAELARPGPVPALSRTETRLTSIGLADTMSFARDRVQITAGARHQRVVGDTFNGATGARTGSRYDEGTISPAAAILVRATRELSFYANYIEGLSQGAVAPATAANVGEVFAPYKTRQKELGFKLDLGRVAHTVSLYEIRRPGAYTDPVSNVFSFGGEQRNRGVEWTFVGAPLRNVRLMGGAAYSSPKMTRAAPASQGMMAIGLPKWQGKLGAEMDVPAVRGLTVMANVNAASRQYLSADNSLSIPGRALFDIGARHATRIGGQPLTVRASVTNVTNRSYWAKPNFTSLALGAPRTFHLSATLDF